MRRDPANLSQKAALHFQWCLPLRAGRPLPPTPSGRSGTPYPNLTPAWAGTDGGELASWESPLYLNEFQKLESKLRWAGSTTGLLPAHFPHTYPGSQNWLFTYAKEQPSQRTDSDNTCLVNESYSQRPVGLTGSLRACLPSAWHLPAHPHRRVRETWGRGQS